VYLAGVRNRLLEPLHALRSASHFSHVLFINDVYFSAASAVALLETNGGDFDGACGLDFYNGFYDRWVTRDAAGHVPGRWYPYFRDPAGAARLAAGLPVPVLGCWNGMAAFPAHAFVKKHLKFRASAPGACYSSECLNIFEDLRALGAHEFFLNPSVIVAYEYRYYLLHRWVRAVARVLLAGWAVDAVHRTPPAPPPAVAQILGTSVVPAPWRVWVRARPPPPRCCRACACARRVPNWWRRWWVVAGTSRPRRCTTRWTRRTCRRRRTAA
jgi:hypothetical protein